MTGTDTSAGLPIFPAAPASRCPFAPPPLYGWWREEAGLRQVRWNGHTVWAVCRYEDIRTAMWHPKLSAEVLWVFQARANQQGPEAPQVFARMDDPGHAQLSRMLTKDVTAKRVNAMRPDIEAMAGELLGAMVALRYLTIVHNTVVHVAIEDVEIGGTLVRAGEGLTTNLPAGNWDPTFTAEPHVLDFTRPTRGHLALGEGVRQCLGQNLARAELQIALPVSLRRLPYLRLAMPVESIRFGNDMNIYGVHSLPVT